MFQTEEIIRKQIVTPEGEDEFQIRFLRSEQVGILTSRSEKSWFILDSRDFWYDLIQETYPPKTKCRCKHDWFRLCFDYTPRIHTEDYRSVTLSACCASCGKEKNLGTIKIDFSPSDLLFSQPLTFCPQPKLQCKTYTLKGYWTDQNLTDLTEFLTEKAPFVYCWYFRREDQKRYLRPVTADELNHFLFGGGQFINIFFSREPLDFEQTPQASDGRGVYVKDAVWRKQEVFKLNGPFLVVGHGYFYSMEFCSEYIDREGLVQPKSEVFSKLVQDFRAYSKKVLRQK